MIIALIVAFAASVLGTGLLGLVSQAPQNGSQTTTGTANASYDAISQQFTSAVAANQAALNKDPKNYGALVAQANNYFDWALTVQRDAKLGQSGQELPLWQQSVSYYVRALDATKTFDPKVGTDMSVAYHYAGENTKAVEMIKRVLKLQPNLPQAVLNAGIFSESANETSTALGFYRRFIGLPGIASVEPTAVAFAKGRVTVLNTAKK